MDRRREPGSRQGPEVQAPRPAQHAVYPWPEKPRLLGTRISRVDGPLKTTGRARYSYDISRPGMLYGRILRSPHAHARVRTIDASGAGAPSHIDAGLPLPAPGMTPMEALRVVLGLGLIAVAVGGVVLLVRWRPQTVTS